MAKYLVIATYEIESCWELDFDPRGSTDWSIKWDTLTVFKPDGATVIEPTYSAASDHEAWKRPSTISVLSGDQR